MKKLILLIAIGGVFAITAMKTFTPLQVNAKVAKVACSHEDDGDVCPCSGSSCVVIDNMK